MSDNAHSPSQQLDSARQQLLDDSRSLWLPTRVCEYTSVPGPLQFLRDHVAQSVPCVWRGAAKQSRAVSLWSSHHHKYLREKVGHREVHVACTPDGRADAVVSLRTTSPKSSSSVFAMPEQRKQSFAALLDDLTGLADQACTHAHTPCPQSTKSHCRGFPYYSAQDSSLSTDMPELLDDIDQSLISFAIEAFGCEPSATNMWVGEHHSVTTTHADPFENLYVVISGTKTFRLRPPSDSAFLSKPSLPRARWTYTHGGACDASDQDAVLQPEKEYAGWELRREEGETEWIDESCINEKCGDDVVVELHAGDMLYLPALWYHHVSQRGITIAVNWWFEMTFGRDWVYRELCSNLRPQARNGPVQAVEGNASSGEF